MKRNFKQLIFLKYSYVSLPSASHLALQEATLSAKKKGSLIALLSLVVTRELVSYFFLLTSSFFILMYVQYFQENLSDSTCVCNHCIRKRNNTLNRVLCCDYQTSGDANGT